MVRAAVAFCRRSGGSCCWRAQELSVGHMRSKDTPALAAACRPFCIHRVRSINVMN